ncbi:hypothetical protein C1I97_22720 [Streptomyces sp. NTH33]|uniref:hypothetical protein n=1 Tax=Streptomyces sp. NTH33 TaxID=1735453 RepID=UPI000DAA540D|nr:hypothetical protein [Streptomyces sp. NTH33]PZH01068.1 hypothetical protein C1I97_22720 [Streptomyces sp. NTH33]
MTGSTVDHNTATAAGGDGGGGIRNESDTVWLIGSGAFANAPDDCGPPGAVLGRTGCTGGGSGGPGVVAAPADHLAAVQSPGRKRHRRLAGALPPLCVGGSDAAQGAFR